MDKNNHKEKTEGVRKFEEFVKRNQDVFEKIAKHSQKSHSRK